MAPGGELAELGQGWGGKLSAEANEALAYLVRRGESPVSAAKIRHEQDAKRVEEERLNIPQMERVVRTFQFCHTI